MVAICHYWHNCFVNTRFCLWIFRTEKKLKIYPLTSGVCRFCKDGVYQGELSGKRHMQDTVVEITVVQGKLIRLKLLKAQSARKAKIKLTKGSPFSICLMSA